MTKSVGTKKKGKEGGTLVGEPAHLLERDREILAHLPDEERQVLERMLSETCQDGQSKTYQSLLELDYEQVPVMPRTFFTSPDYIGHLLEALSPKWLDELDCVLDPSRSVTEWVIKGAIGTGKTTASALAICYKLYSLACLRAPAEFFQLLPGSIITFAFFSITMDKADLGFESLRYWIQNSPWFKEYAPIRDHPADPITIPSKRLSVMVGSLSTHTLGEHLFGYALDESNFFKKAPGRTSRPSDRTRAHQIYRQAMRRQMSRFSRFGAVPGLTCLLGSEQTETAFLEEREKSSKNNPHVHVTRFALWDVKPADQFTGERFDVVVGDGVRESRILEEDELPPRDARVIRVPTEYRKPFEEDPVDSIRDLAGLPVPGTGRFFAVPERLEDCIDLSRPHPMTQEQIPLSTKDVESSLVPYLQADLLFRIRRSSGVPIVNPACVRFAHVDIGLTGTPAALAVGHLTPMGCLYYDLLLRILPPQWGEVDLDAIVAFLKYLRTSGFRFRTVTYDSYQSRHSIQHLCKAGFNGGTLSIGYDAYRELRRRIYDGPGACSYYRYLPLLDELKALLMPAKDGAAPDHPVNGTDDVAQVAAGVAYHVASLSSQGAGRRGGNRYNPTDYLPARGVLSVR